MQYRISGGEPDSAWKCGQTLDMSAGGIFMDAIEAVPISSTLELEIDWPGLYHDKPMVRLLVIGSVVRSDVRGTALRIVSHQFRQVHPAVVPSRRAEGNFAVSPSRVHRVRFAGR